MTPEPSIEPFARAHLDGLIALVAAEGWTAYTKDAARTYRALSGRGVTMLVALAGERVVGAIQVQSDGVIQAHVSMAERVLEDAERTAIDIGDRWFQSTILVDRAHAILAQDRPDAAAEAVARIDDVPAPCDMEWRVKRHAARGKLAAIEGNPDHALREARAATALADSTEMFTFRADAHRDLAEVATRCHRHEEARAAAATALALYEAKENVAAAALLQRL